MQIVPQTNRNDKQEVGKYKISYRTFVEGNTKI